VCKEGQCIARFGLGEGGGQRETSQRITACGVGLNGDGAKMKKLEGVPLGHEKGGQKRGTCNQRDIGHFIKKLQEVLKKKGKFSRKIKKKARLGLGLYQKTNPPP